MDEKTFKLGSFLTAMVAAVVPLTTAVSKYSENLQQDRKFEHESQMRYIDLLVSDEGQRDWYFRRDVLSFYAEVLPKDHPVKSWAQKELKLAEQEVAELEKLKDEQVKAELAINKLQSQEVATKTSETSAVVAKEAEAMLLGKQLEFRAQRGALQPLTPNKSSTHSCSAEVIQRKPSTKVLRRATIDLNSTSDMDAQRTCDEWALHEFAEILEDGLAAMEGRYCFRSLRRADRKIVVSGAIHAPSL